MASQGLRLRRQHLLAAVALVCVACWSCWHAPCAMMMDERAPGQLLPSKALRKRAANGEFWSSNNFDTNAVGEGWRSASMHQWKPRTSSIKIDESADNLERELMATRIGGRAGSQQRRLEMHKKRLARTRLLEARRHERQQAFKKMPGHRAPMLASISYDPLALAERFGRMGRFNPRKRAEDLEQELQGAVIGRRSSSEGHRLAMQQKRMAA
eukprot:TRINITY_DN109302_c0_g1_i1.p1 TRINITY_DN109302_c0_g1~~TRINITY_DN109302_c0_g1_i1.p1  ORF type:complete len:231 (+),score=41.42 TRINITY_DN109302_c0_g1_i1:59-694(+)